MDFKYIEQGENIFKSKHYLKDRDLSILEFQMRIFDLITIEDTPFLERLNFIKIICSNLEEFIAIRLPDIKEEVKELTIHTIEEIYLKLGTVLMEINTYHSICLDPDNDLYKVIKNRNFRYVYAGESEIEVEAEIDAIINIKESAKCYSILYSGNSNDIKLEDVESIIHVPICILVLDDYVQYYQSRYRDDITMSYPKNVCEINHINYYEKLRYQDVLIYNPYESYDSVLDFIDQMCTHPNIKSVFITLYRTAHDSQIIQSLLKARENGKFVCVYIEPTARDNEIDNLNNLKTLRKAGIHVSCNYYNFKVHGKMFCAVDKSFKKYIHIGTGNYNEITEKYYTDLHLLTTNDAIGDEVMKILISLFEKRLYKSPDKNIPVYSSPLNFRATLNQLIDDERRKKEKGKIWIKCNNFCDCSVIDKLYQAADAGVKVFIICRTGCSVYPHKNITIRSKVGQYLEHDRFYIFGDKVFISSADLLLRNISKRVEILCEIQDTYNKEKIHNIFRDIWNSKNIHELQSDGKWKLLS